MNDAMISDEQLLEWFQQLRSEKTTVRNEVYQRLAQVAWKNFAGFFRLLDSSNEETQRLIMIFLAYMEMKRVSHPNTVMIFFEKLLEADNPDFRSFCINRLRQIIGNPVKRHIPDEMLELLFHADTEIRYLMILLIRQNHYSKAIPHLIHLLNDDEMQISQAAAQALEKFSQPDARVALAEWRKQA